MRENVDGWMEENEGEMEMSREERQRLRSTHCVKFQIGRASCRERV